MRIRPIQPNDLDALLTLCQEHADYEQLPFESNGQIGRWRQLFFAQPPRIHVWVCEENGDLQGYMSVTIDYATWTGEAFAYMDCLFLRPNFRGRGAGRAFINTLRQFSADQGCSEMQWHTPPHNQLGIDFYRHIGADEQPKLRYFLRNTT